jgi:hypothetical protein
MFTLLTTRAIISNASNLCGTQKASLIPVGVPGAENVNVSDVPGIVLEGRDNN